MIREHLVSRLECALALQSEQRSGLQPITSGWGWRLAFLSGCVLALRSVKEIRHIARTTRKITSSSKPAAGTLIERPCSVLAKPFSGKRHDRQSQERNRQQETRIPRMLRRSPIADFHFFFLLPDNVFLFSMFTYFPCGLKPKPYAASMELTITKELSSSSWAIRLILNTSGLEQAQMSRSFSCPV